ncbi:MAG: hypothetical protein ABWK01_07920 [Infirmifilum sp.]
MSGYEDIEDLVKSFNIETRMALKDKVEPRSAQRVLKAWSESAAAVADDLIGYVDVRLQTYKKELSAEEMEIIRDLLAFIAWVVADAVVARIILGDSPRNAIDWVARRLLSAKGYEMINSWYEIVVKNIEGLESHADHDKSDE